MARDRTASPQADESELSVDLVRRLYSERHAGIARMGLCSD